MTKRAAVFVHYDRDDIVDPYVYVYLDALRRVCGKIIFVSASKLSASEIERLSHTASEVILRENVGYDFMSYKEGLAHFDLTQYDEVVICNDSLYGPFFPLEEMFTAMSAQKACDFWGITANSDMGYHLQSYFLVFKKTLVQSDIFQSFWEQVTVLPDKEQIIETYEVGLTQTFLKNGYSAQAYVSFDPTPLQKASVLLKKITPAKVAAKIKSLLRKEYHIKRVGKINLTLFFWRELLLQSRMPFIKIKLLRENPNNIDISTVTDTIAHISDYDTSLIENHLARMERKPV